LIVRPGKLLPAAERASSGGVAVSPDQVVEAVEPPTVHPNPR